jgi:hypothetical protein
MQRRINVSLSEESVRVLDQLAPKGDRSRLIERLLLKTARDRAELRRLLKERALRRYQVDKEMAAEWDPLADEAWQKLPEK